MPSGPAGRRVFELTKGDAPPAMKVQETDGKLVVSEESVPILAYNFQTVPVPPGVKGRYAVARSNYIHPLYGPEGEVLTCDFSKDYPHHRGLYWAWPEVTYKNEKRDLHALQGVFARPVKIHRTEAGSVFAEIVVENLWKWGGDQRDRNHAPQSWPRLFNWRARLPTTDGTPPIVSSSEVTIRIFTVNKKFN